LKRAPGSLVILSLECLDHNISCYCKVSRIIFVFVKCDLGIKLKNFNGPIASIILQLMEHAQQITLMSEH
jgi:hypothetical protein